MIDLLSYILMTYDIEITCSSIRGIFIVGKSRNTDHHLIYAHTYKQK